MLATDLDRPLYDDPVADAVADHIREERGQLVWEEYEFPASLPRPDLLLRFGDGLRLRITDYGLATCCLLTRHKDLDEAKREAPAAMLAKLETAASDLRKLLGRAK